MYAKPQRPKEQESATSALKAAIDALNLMEYHTGQGCLWPCQHPSRNDKDMFPALLRQFAPDSHVARTRWLTNWVELRLSCAAVCRALERWTSGKKPDEISRTVYDAMEQMKL